MDSPQRDASVAPAEPTLPALKDLSPHRGLANPNKRPAASLLPAFEPLSSSPGLPRPLKRQNTGTMRSKYPTPVPTSSTALMSSSPTRSRTSHKPQQHRGTAASAIRRSPFVRTSSTASSSVEARREPLSDLPTVHLPDNGEVLMMGRSSNSSHFQLSANRLVSRVHVKARYIASPSGSTGGKMEIVCNGWNGLKVHCQGRTWELLKGDSFTSETEGTGIMLEVHESRVLVQWPGKRSAAAAAAADSDNDSSASSWDDAANLLPPHSSSPMRRSMRSLQSPESPTAAHLAVSSSSQRLQALFPTGGHHARRPSRDDHIQIYEDDEDRQDEDDEGDSELPDTTLIADPGASMRTEVNTASFSSELSDPAASDEEDDQDPDEENDPVVHSFGPFGADISGRLASIFTASPSSKQQQRRRRDSEASLTPLRDETPSPPSPTPVKRNKPAAVKSEEPKPQPEEVKLEEEAEEEVKPPPVDASIVNHAVNQLAFSRLSSTPLSTIMQHLPADAKVGLTRPALLAAIESTPCIGIITRQGKDAAGKPLESEYYYVPEADADESRRAAVVDGLRKPTLRNCRKQHKVCTLYLSIHL